MADIVPPTRRCGARCSGPDRRGARAAMPASRPGRCDRGATAGGRVARSLLALGRKPRARPAAEDDSGPASAHPRASGSAGATGARRPARWRAPAAPWPGSPRAIRHRHGRLWGDRSLLAPLALGLVCNDHGSETIGPLIEPHLRRAAAAPRATALLPAQARPVVMNTKGASASGKSTMRPLQRQLAERARPRLGRLRPRSARTSGASTCSTTARSARRTSTPARSPATSCDRRPEARPLHGAQGRARRMPHLLIDRFRFDSFAPDSDEAAAATC